MERGEHIGSMDKPEDDMISKTFFGARACKMNNGISMEVN
jgi:hypothetical protein